MVKAFAELPARLKVLSALVVLCLVALLGIGAFQAGRAALVFFSDDYVAEFAQTHIGVALTENGVIVEGDDDLLKDPELFLDGDEVMALGKEYAEELSVVNTTDMAEYVRLTVRTYWADADRAKTPELDPALIELVYDSPDWVFNPDESTAERAVFYYRYRLEPSEAALSPAVRALRVSTDLADSGQDFSDCHLALAAQVDSVQYQHAAEAAKSAWGVDVNALGLDWS